jgi:myosin heavy subunit
MDMAQMEINRLRAVVRDYESAFDKIAQRINNHLINGQVERVKGMHEVLDLFGLEFGGQYIKYK